MPPRTNTLDNYTVSALKHLIYSKYEANPQAKIYGLPSFLISMQNDNVVFKHIFISQCFYFRINEL